MDTVRKAEPQQFELTTVAEFEKTARRQFGFFDA